MTVKSFKTFLENKDDPCWDGYTQLGMKKKGGKEVPNCVKEEDTEYQKFFKKALAKFDVKEPDELTGEKKKEFFDYVDANWDAKNETD